MSFYDQGNVSPQEMERERLFEYPNLVSRELLGEVDLANAKVLDVGCGSNPGMLEYVCGQSGFYTGLDLLPQKLGELQSAVNGKSYRYKLMNFDLTAGSLPVENKAFDYTHMRFVLMHIADISKHPAIIREVLRVTKKTAWFSEWDWSTAQPYPLGREDREWMTYFTDRFLRASKRFMQLVGIHHSLGQYLHYVRLLDEVGQFGITEYRVNQRPLGDYSAEVIPLSQAAIAAAKDEIRRIEEQDAQTGLFLRATELAEVVRELEETAEYFVRNGAILRPPAICTIVVHKKSMM